MIRYTINRVLMLIPVIIVVSFIVFTLLELAPGDIVDSMTTGDMTAEDIATLRAMYNLDKSMFYRYGLYMLGLIQGNLGTSQATGMSVFDVYMSRLPNTLLLSFTAVAIGIVVAIPIGILAARKAGTITDTATTTLTLVGMSMPSFWLGLLLLLFFSLQLKWVPGGGNKEGLRSLILPAICSAMNLTAMIARQTRSSMLEVLRADYLRTARAKGAPEKIVIRRHALGNALIPIVTQIGASVCVQLAGSAVIEQVFTWPGVGRMLIEGVQARDVTTVLGCTIMTTILYVLVMLIVDLLYAFIDPRIKSQYMRQKKKRAAIVLPVTGAQDFVPVTVMAGLGNGDAATEWMQEDIPVGILTTETESGDLAGVSYSSAESDAYTGVSATSSIPSANVEANYVTRMEGSFAVSDMAHDAAGIIARHKKRSQLGDIWHRLTRNKGSMAGLIILGCVLLVAIVSLFMPFSSVTAQNIQARLSPPSWQYPFGTDSMGRNIFLRVIYGSRYTLIIGFGAVAVSAFFGVTLGSSAAYFGGKTENVIMRISDILASIPGLLLGMVIMVMLGMNLQNLIIAVGITGIPQFIRMSRASILTVKGNEYVEAARAIGYSDFRILITQVIPNGLSPILVQITVILGLNIMLAASLSYLGFGVQAPTPEWGTLIAAGRNFARPAPWLMAFPGIAIMITVLGFNLLGDGLRDALDPKLKK